jgi:hypothetical protein
MRAQQENEKTQALEPATQEKTCFQNPKRLRHAFGVAADEKQDTAGGDCRTRARLSASHERGANPEGKIRPAAKKLKSWCKT